MNRIWVVYLPSHSSQAFQLLDVGVFNYFKRRFRRYFRARLSEATDKVDFLWALKRAWQDTMGRTSFILTGWSTSGMWPVSLEKSLRDRFVKESLEAQKAAIVTDSPDNEPDFLAEAVSRPAKTPASSRDMIRLQRQLAIDDPSFNQPTHRLLFQKLGKALDSQSFTITAKDQELDRAYKAFAKRSHRSDEGLFQPLMRTSYV